MYRVACLQSTTQAPCISTAGTGRHYVCVRAVKREALCVGGASVIRGAEWDVESCVGKCAGYRGVCGSSQRVWCAGGEAGVIRGAKWVQESCVRECAGNRWVIGEDRGCGGETNVT